MSGIEVLVETQFVAGESKPEEQQFLFAYTITISNHGSAAAQLLNRHWLVTDGTGDVKEVKGPGVVGKQPRLRVGESFSYTSGAVLATPVGSMRGSYQFQRDDGTLFDVPIDVFTLSVPNAVH